MLEGKDPCHAALDFYLRRPAAGQRNQVITRVENLLYCPACENVAPWICSPVPWLARSEWALLLGVGTMNRYQRVEVCKLGTQPNEISFPDHLCSDSAMGTVFNS